MARADNFVIALEQLIAEHEDELRNAKSYVSKQNPDFFTAYYAEFANLVAKVDQLKANFTDADALAAAIVAFSNTIGGQIFIGVHNDGSVLGLSGADIDRLNQLNVAGGLLFAKTPNYALPAFIVKAVAFVGNEIEGERSIDSRDITGKLAIENIKAGNSNMRNPILRSPAAVSGS